MARDGTNRGGRRVRAGDKPAPAAEKIQKGQQVQILKNDIPTLSPTELEAVDLPEGAVMNGVDMPKPSDYLSARQKNGIPLGADEIYKERAKLREVSQSKTDRDLRSSICQIHSVRGGNKYIRSAWQASDHGRSDHFSVCADEPTVPKECKPHLV